MEDITEIELIQMVSRSESRDEGFNILFDKYKQELYGYIRKMVITHENADDVLQNTFIKVFKNIDGFRGDASLKSWIYRIAYNEALQLIRKNKRQATEHSEELNSYSNTLFADPYFRGERVHKVLLEAVASLPERQKQVFELKYFEEFKYSEIAEMLKLSDGSLKASYHHAVQKIKEFVKLNSTLE